MAQPKDKPGKPSTNGTTPPEKEPERLPAYFLSLTLENVRCFGLKQTLDLSDGNGKPARWTIILGLNGTGKTTLLQSLALDQHPPAMPKRGLKAIPVFAFIHDELPLVRNAEAPATILFSYSASVALADSSKHVIETRLTLKPNNVGAELLNAQSHPINLDFFTWCCAYGAGRRVGSASLSESDPNDPTATLFSDRAELRNPEEWLLQLDYAAATAPKNKDAQQRLALAKELLLAVMPEGEITDIRCVPGSGPNPKARAEFRTPYGWVPLRQLGYGYQTLITWVADLANRMAERYPDSKNPLAEPAVVLVDEIDLHLHPKWQRKLMSFLTDRFPNTQFIATAHSPLVAQAAADANLAVLRREGDHVAIDNDVDDIRNWRIDQILTSDLFGLETARPPHVEERMVERNKLLEKSRLNATERRRLEELNALVDELPFGETAQERKERAAIKSALDALTKAGKPTT